MKKFITFLLGAAVAFTAAAGINALEVFKPNAPLPQGNGEKIKSAVIAPYRITQATAMLRANRDVSVPYNLYVDPGMYSCDVRWDDDENSAWNLRYRLYSEEPEVELIGSIAGTDFSGSSTGYYDITLPAPWGGTNVRGGLNKIIYFRNNYNGTGTSGNITYTIPDGYEDATFTMKITTATTNDGSGNLAVATPQTAAVNHTFSINETFAWVVTASTGQKITITTSDANYSPDIALIEVYTGDATDMKKANEWTYANNLIKKSYTITDLEMATEYEVQVQAIGANGTLSDWTRSDVFTTLEEEPIIEDVHILGEVDDQVWASDAGTKMEYNPATETYTATVHVGADKTFGFTTQIDPNDELGGWNYVNLYRFGPEIDGEGPFDLTEDQLGKQLPLGWGLDNCTDVHVLVAGDYEITVSLERNYVIIGRLSEPEHGYDIGDVNHDGFVTIKDVTSLIDYLLGNDSGVCLICADVSGDGDVSIKDVTSLIDMLLGNSSN
ncbi:MAG: hypothetical protein IKZ92_03465 [Muribaculaceae bacterium]|nr:hypothetical protein [Muribaculaceae bacterium]